jgi:hypothetical protein
MFFLAIWSVSKAGVTKVTAQIRNYLWMDENSLQSKGCMADLLFKKKGRRVRPSGSNRGSHIPDV